MLSYMVAVIHGNYSFNLKQTGYFFSVVETFHLLFSLTIEIYSGKMQMTSTCFRKAQLSYYHYYNVLHEMTKRIKNKETENKTKQ